MATNDALNNNLAGQTGTGQYVGDTAPTTSNLTADNLNLNVNTISSTNANGDIIITPNGTGDVVLDGVNWPQADGTAGQILETDGAGQTSWSPPTNGLTGVVAFGSTGTWTKPLTFTSKSLIKVCVVGGGGGGGGASGTGSGSGAGGGGGGGGYTEEILTDAALGASVAVTIGAGGIAGTTAANGGAGGTSSFAAFCSASGGQGGFTDVARSTVVGPANAGNAGGVGTGGDVIVRGGDGTTGVIYNTNCTGGNGGDSYYGGVTRGQNGSAVGRSGRVHGGGGSGGSTNSGTGRAGGAGAAGAVFVYEYE